MMRTLWTAVLLAACSSALATDSVKATVGHMCCGGCKSAAIAGAKSIPWADDAVVDGTVMTVTAKEGARVELISLVEAMNKAGFPAREILAEGPVTLTIAHLCCPACANDLKTAVSNLRGQVIDKDNAKVDAAAKTLTIGPVAGRKMNVVALLSQLGRAGFSATSCTL